MNTHKSQRVAIYCRCATNDQDFLESQKEVVKSFVKQHGNWCLTRIYTDVGSGLENELADLRKGAKAHEFDVIAVHSYSRLTRRPNELLSFLEEMEKYNIVIEPVHGERIGLAFGILEGGLRCKER